MTTDPKDTAQEPTMTAWDMATSILVGLHKAEAKARAEYTQRHAEAGKPFGPGVSQAAHLLEALSLARRNLDPDLRGIARANRLAMPEIERQ